MRIVAIRSNIRFIVSFFVKVVKRGEDGKERRGLHSYWEGGGVLIAIEREKGRNYCIFGISYIQIMQGIVRSNIKPGIFVKIILKQDQRSGKLTEGVVKNILTNSPGHPHGIKVQLETGEVGRVKFIMEM